MPFEAHEDAEVCRRLAKFKKELGIVCAVLTAAVVPCVFIPRQPFYDAVSHVGGRLHRDPVYTVPASRNRDLKRIKRDRGWAAARRHAHG